jgi:hypothetical protein
LAWLALKTLRISPNGSSPCLSCTSCKSNPWNRWSRLLAIDAGCTFPSSGRRVSLALSIELGHHVRAGGGRRLESRVKGQVDLLAEWQNAMADLERSLEGAFYGELLELAMHRVEKRVKPRNWQAFRLTTIEGFSGADAADRLQMPVAQLYVARNRVQKLLQEEILILRGE